MKKIFLSIVVSMVLIFSIFASFSFAATTINDITDIARMGHEAVNSSWENITYNASFTNPVVIAEPVSYISNEQAHIRIKNVGSNSFEVQVEEWQYQDGVHGNEQISWIVFEKGEYLLANELIQIGTVSVDNVFASFSFVESFDAADTVVLLTQSQTYNGPDPIVTRNRNIGTTGFETQVQEEEALGTHSGETVGYVAGIDGLYNGITKDMEMGATGPVNHNWKTLNFKQTYPGTPFFAANMLTTNEMDTAMLRYKQLTTSTVQVKVEEEQSLDSETNHANEKVGWLAIE